MAIDTEQLFNLEKEANLYNIFKNIYSIRKNLNVRCWIYDGYVNCTIKWSPKLSERDRRLTFEEFLDFNKFIKQMYIHYKSIYEDDGGEVIDKKYS